VARFRPSVFLTPGLAAPQRSASTKVPAWTKRSPIWSRDGRVFMG